MSNADNMIVVDQVQFILPSEITEVTRCKRGFWWVDKTENKANWPWDSSKLLLHNKEDLTPIRTPSGDVLAMKTSAIPVNKDHKVVECSYFMLKVVAG
jgi:hypothetical protein